MPGIPEHLLKSQKPVRLVSSRDPRYKPFSGKKAKECVHQEKERKNTAVPTDTCVVRMLHVISSTTQSLKKLTTFNHHKAVVTRTPNSVLQTRILAFTLTLSLMLTRSCSLACAQLHPHYPSHLPLLPLLDRTSVLASCNQCLQIVHCILSELDSKLFRIAATFLSWFLWCLALLWCPTANVFPRTII